MRLDAKIPHPLNHPIDNPGGGGLVVLRYVTRDRCFQLGWELVFPTNSGRVVHVTSIIARLEDIGADTAVKWNSPFYGRDDQGWFLNFHCIAKYLKVAFFRGTALHPVPPVESKHPEVRYFHIHEHDPFDKAQLASWIKQANQLPGERMQAPVRTGFG